MSTAIENPCYGQAFYEGLSAGDEGACRELACRLVENEGVSIRSLCDALTEAFHRIGSAWESSELTIYQEHVASQIGGRLMLDLRSVLPSPNESLLTAIGCTPERDPYVLPTAMVELVLRDAGWHAQSLGTNLPLEFLAPAMDRIKPQLCWVSVSYIQSTVRLHEQLSALSELSRNRGIEVVCGGRALIDDIKRAHSDITFLESLSTLEEFASRWH